jgi:hypothetical protein
MHLLPGKNNSFDHSAQSGSYLSFQLQLALWTKEIKYYS